MRRVTHVYGPAYQDRVVLVDQPLHEPGQPPLDQSVDGVWEFGEGLTLRDASGFSLVVELPPRWPGPNGTVVLGARIGGETGTKARTVRATSWHDDLGGMGSGFAAALGGTLISALGSETDPMSLAISERLRRAEIRHRPIRVEGRSADWTLLLTSGPDGDKLPVGFRGCHSALYSLAREISAEGACDLRVVASFPNRLASEALRAEGARVRLFAPAMRNMIDRSEPVGRFAGSIDLLCCNRREWESLEAREEVAWQVSLLAVTDGSNGSIVRFTTTEGEAGKIVVPATPRGHPPRDTNRAGEAYAACLVQTLLDNGWSPGVTTESLAEHAAQRASAAAALVLDRTDFGFPLPAQIDEVVRARRLPSED